MQNDTLYNFKAYPFNKTKLHEIDTVFTLYYYIKQLVDELTGVKIIYRLF